MSEASLILVVDDDQIVRYARGRVLTAAGFRVVEAETGQQALERVEAEEPAIALIDVGLPDIIGTDVARRIKQSHPSVLILQHSAAFRDSRHRTAGLDNGADSFLTDPVEPEELIATVRALLRIREAERALRRANDELEERVATRTAALADANRHLHAEIEDRRQAESQLRQAQKMEVVGQLTGTLAHDFNNLLTIISGNLELMAQTLQSERPELAPKCLRLLGSAEKAVQRGELLTRQLLAFSRQESLRPERVDINEVLLDFTDFLKRALGDRVALDIRRCAGVLPCRLDRPQFEAALLNLAVNSRDAMPRGGSWVVETEERIAAIPVATDGEDGTGRSLCRISISDTGTGMSAETIARAFDPFYTTKERGKGTGLGLSQVSTFVSESGGHIAIESAPGNGACFIIDLPRLSEAVT